MLCSSGIPSSITALLRITKLPVTFSPTLDSEREDNPSESPHPSLVNHIPLGLSYVQSLNKRPGDCRIDTYVHLMGI